MSRGTTAVLVRRRGWRLWTRSARRTTFRSSHTWSRIWYTSSRACARRRWPPSRSSSTALACRHLSLSAPPRARIILLRVFPLPSSAASSCLLPLHPTLPGDQADTRSRAGGGGQAKLAALGVVEGGKSSGKQHNAADPDALSRRCLSRISVPSHLFASRCALKWSDEHSSVHSRTAHALTTDASASRYEAVVKACSDFIDQLTAQTRACAALEMQVLERPPLPFVFPPSFSFPPGLRSGVQLQCSRPLHTCTRVRSHESTHAQVLSVEVALQRPGADKEVRANLFASAPQCRSVIQPSPAPLAPLLLGPHIFKYNGNGCRPCLRSGARCVRSWRTCSCRKKSGRCWPARCRLSCTASAPWCPPATRLVLCLPPPVHLLSPTRC